VATILSQFYHLKHLNVGELTQDQIEPLQAAVPCMQPTTLQQVVSLSTIEQDNYLEDILDFYLVLRNRVDAFYGYSVHQEISTRSPRRGFLEDQLDTLELLYNRISDMLKNDIITHTGDEGRLKEIVLNYKIRLYHRYMKISSKLRKYKGTVDTYVPVAVMDGGQAELAPSFDFTEDLELFKELLVKKEDKVSPPPSATTRKAIESNNVEIVDALKVISKGSNKLVDFKDQTPLWKRIITILGVWILPLLIWVPEYFQGGWKKVILTNIKGDIFSAVTIAMILVPQSISYSLVAGLPAEYGLYTSVIPALIYPFLGSSRCLSVGPTAVISLLTASAVAGMKPVDINEYVSYAVLLAIIVGSLQVLLGVFRLGFLINFLSKPVLSGFTSACVIIIAVGQLKNIFSVTIDDNAQQLHVLLESLGKAIFTPTYKGSDQGVHWPSFGMGIGCISLFLFLTYFYIPIKKKKWGLSTFIPVRF
jgi:hypothetical protein